MNRSKSTLQQLPAELIANVLSRATFEDVSNLKLAVCGYHSWDIVAKECDHRLSVKTYLEREFGNSETVLRAMSQNFVYLSGSRSLEFFVPGSTSAESDWDFFMQEEACRVSMFLSNMEAAGVVWHNPAEWLQMCLDKGCGNMVVAPETYHKMKHHGCFNGIRIEGSIPNDPSLRTRKAKVCMSISGSKVTFTDLHEAEDYMPDLAYMIRGQVTVRSVTANVQLIVGTHDDPTDMKFLYTFHSSCVQSFIAAHAACHMYGKMASKRLTYQWANHMDSEPRRGSAAKYIERGFKRKTIVAVDRGFVVRNSDDEKSSILVGFNHIGAPDIVVNCYINFVRSMTWFETLYATEQAKLPMDTRWPRWYDAMDSETGSDWISSADSISASVPHHILRKWYPMDVDSLAVAMS